ncbi:acetaldehyde dehydrogenase (acetylating) [Halomonas meridiana]|uniref:acetaldehyde dehydrogenase (acetylating) n=1 Tax=Vreelandella aquamarina TaxID=77097 RepID=UPI00273C807F|nr:acetaldehyde dehydrogenase (acetylating) [Halomonas meridiana]MDP4557619.1 acetaldehyde dehydrogenase (acetylating) [Halomonas meridiana]
MLRKVAIIGTGSIGIDLMYKTIKSKKLNLSFFVGRRVDSPGIQEANKNGIITSSQGVDFLEKHINDFDIVFDATSADAHVENDKIFKKYNKLIIDLTPAKIGELCVPVININSLKQSRNINLITCGGQASLPLAYAIKKSCEEIEYIEVISSISSDSAGIATRKNLDEYITTTEFALKKFTNSKSAKAILNINPAMPQVCMQTTLYAHCKKINNDALKKNISAIINMVKQYVPGYQLALEPIVQLDKITLAVQVYGSGDYLPKHAGNLDIINSAAISIAESRSTNIV